MKAVILAGGKGTRLRPLTYSIPKPLLPIGRKPILEIIIERLREHNVEEVILTVEYKAELIRSYFRDGNGLGIRILYHQENRFSGTAGPVKQVEHLLDGEPFITMNGDLLTDLDFTKMYQTHLDQSSELTIATAGHTVTLPYGVIDTQDDKIISIREKPTLKFLINAGIYILSPSTLGSIPEDGTYDMPDLIQQLVNDGKKVINFPIYEYWLDIGGFEDYRHAQNDFNDG